jgi:ABC-type sulfate transport system permease component
MVFRSFVVLMLLIFLFNPQSDESSPFLGSLEDFIILASYLTSYLLFIFAALSLIIFIANLGLYLVASDRNRLNIIKKSCFCLVCVLLPLGFQFPNMPLWRV